MYVALYIYKWANLTLENFESQHFEKGFICEFLCFKNVLFLYVHFEKKRVILMYKSLWMFFFDIIVCLFVYIFIILLVFIGLD